MVAHNSIATYKPAALGIDLMHDDVTRLED